MWKERKIDLWSLNHLIFGCTLAMMMRGLGISFSFGIFFALVIFIIWEFIEIYNKEGEVFINQLTDIIFETFGFVIFFFNTFSNLINVTLIISFFILEFFGYHSKIKLGVRVKLYIFYIVVVFLYSVVNLILL